MFGDKVSGVRIGNHLIEKAPMLFRKAVRNFLQQAVNLLTLGRHFLRRVQEFQLLEKRLHVIAWIYKERSENGAPAYQPPYNDLHGGEAQFLVDYHDYYRTPRSYHARAVNSGNSWTQTTPLSFMNMPVPIYITESRRARSCSSMAKRPIRVISAKPPSRQRRSRRNS